MKAAVFHGVNQPLTVEDIEIAKPMAREIVVRTAASGVCHSDLHFVEGLWPFPPPAVLGHEAAGIVEEVGEQVTYVKPGDHVIACLSVFCGHCEQCLTGHPNRCFNPETRRAPDDPPRLSQNGQPVNQFINISSFAEKMLLHENAVVKIREDMPLEAAALIGCGSPASGPEAQLLIFRQPFSDRSTSGAVRDDRSPWTAPLRIQVMG